MPATGIGVLADAERLSAVRRVLTAGIPPESLDRLTSLSAQLLAAPYAQVSLITDEQVVASVAGLDLVREERIGPRDDSLCTVTLLAGQPVAIRDTTADPRVAALPPVSSGHVRSYLGAPVVDRAGHGLGALCVYDSAVRDWTPEQTSLLNELAASVAAELELAALSAEMSQSTAQLDLALSAADIGSFDLDLSTQRLEWDDRLLALFGYTREDFPRHWDGFAARVHPDDLATVQAAVERAMTTTGEFASEYRIQVPGVGLRWVQARGRILPDLVGRPARLLGAAYDVTELRTTRDSIARVLETMSDAFFSLDPEWRFSYVNGEAERVLLRQREELIGVSIWDAFPDAVGSTFQTSYERAVATGEMVSFEEYFPLLDAWFEARAWPTAEGLSVYFHDVTERRQAQDQREAAILDSEQAYAAAEAANARLRLLADASTRLSESLEPRAVLQTLADIVVPEFGGYAVVALLAETAAPLLGTDQAGDPERVHVVHVQHADPEAESVLVDLLAGIPLSVHDENGVGRVIRTGTPEWLPEVPDSVLVELAPDEERLAALRQLDVSSALTLPLASRGRRLGAITVAEPAGSYLDRDLLMDLAARAGVALDNALLYGAERRTGLTLQRSLLPRDLPVLPGLELAPSYIPGATGAFVGGDWYQGVPYGDGIVLAMGDVMGHGMRSAARMGQLRAIVATLALEGHRPGELLRRLSASTDVLLDLELATLLVCHYSMTERTLTVASAGHPPPLLAPADGEPEFVGVVPGPPIGTVVSSYAETVVDVPRGATLVLYTDGLVENRDESLTDGLERLRDVVRGVRLPPARVRDHILTELGRAAGGADDVAMLVLAHA
jgi:serine phosphatase RsbU (regulator of sigma subunit)/PAS domain-containing protein